MIEMDRSKGRDGTGRDETGRDGTGRDGTGRDGTVSHETAPHRENRRAVKQRVSAVELSGVANPVKLLLKLSPPDAGVLAALYIRYPEERLRYISRSPRWKEEESKWNVCPDIFFHFSIFPIKAIQKCSTYMSISYRLPAESHSMHRWQGWRGKYLGHQADFHL